MSSENSKDSDSMADTECSDSNSSWKHLLALEEQVLGEHDEQVEGAVTDGPASPIVERRSGPSDRRAQRVEEVSASSEETPSEIKTPERKRSKLLLVAALGLVCVAGLYAFLSHDRTVPLETNPTVANMLSRGSSSGPVPVSGRPEATSQTVVEKSQISQIL